MEKQKKIELWGTWEGWCLRDDMGEVVVDGLDVGVHGGDHVEADADATTDVDEHLDANEGAVHREQLLHDDGGVVPHELIEQTVEPGIGAVVLERRHPVVLVEGDATLQHRILQVVPGVVTLIYEIYIVSKLPHFHEELIVAIHIERPWNHHRHAWPSACRRGLRRTSSKADHQSGSRRCS